MDQKPQKSDFNVYVLLLIAFVIGVGYFVYSASGPRERHWVHPEIIKQQQKAAELKQLERDIADLIEKQDK